MGIVDNATGKPVGLESTHDLSDNAGHPVESVRLSLEIWPALYNFIGHLARDMGTTRGEAIRKATGLLRLALDAKRDGKKLVIVDDETGEEEEITGI